MPSQGSGVFLCISSPWILHLFFASCIEETMDLAVCQQAASVAAYNVWLALLEMQTKRSRDERPVCLFTPCKRCRVCLAEVLQFILLIYFLIQNIFRDQNAPLCDSGLSRR